MALVPRSGAASALARRLVTIPAVLGLACLGALSAPLWLSLLLGVDAFGRRRLASVRLGLFAMGYLACEVAGILACCGLWLRQLALREGREVWLRRNFRLQCWWAGAIWAIARRVYRLELSVESDSDLSRGPILLFLRHASLGDTLLGALLFARPYGLRLRYVLKRELLVDPCLDIVGHRLPNVFVRRDGADTPREIGAVAELARDLGPSDGVLIYPEGTRFTRDKQRRLVERLKEKGNTALAVRAERMRNVLPPRPGGPLALLDAAPDADVVLCMHHGFEAAGTAGDLWSGRLIGSRIQVRCVRIPAREIPADRAAWLLDRWDDVDAFVTDRQRSREVDPEGADPREPPRMPRGPRSSATDHQLS